MQQHQGLPGDRQRRLVGKAAPLEVGQAAVALGVGEQHDFVGVLQAEPGPGGVAAICGQIDRAALRLDPVDEFRDRAVRPPDRAFGLGAKPPRDVVGRDDDDRPVGRRLCGPQVCGERGGI